MIRTTLYALLFALVLPIAHACAMDAYCVEFSGEFSPETLSLLQTTSQLYELMDSPPATAAGLRHRAEADIPNFIKVLHSQSFYNARVDLDFDFNSCPSIVYVNINAGPPYPLSSFVILSSTPISECEGSPFDSISLCDLGITLDRVTHPNELIEAEDTLLDVLARLGYPLAVIRERKVIADQEKQVIYVTLYVDSGPAALFGETTIEGLCNVKSAFFAKKLAWMEGCPYDPEKVRRTQNALEASGLFTTIAISNDDAVTEDNFLPMRIEVEEGRHRSIGWGLNYNTEWGPGASFEWQHRNLWGLGERLTFKTDVWQRSQEAKLLYVKPDYILSGQDLLWLLEAQHETTLGFHEASISISRMLERQLDDQTKISYGIMYKNLKDTHADRNGDYNLIKFPCYLRWSNANSLLDPTEGRTINLKVIPSFQVLQHKFAYCINTFTASFYYPLSEDQTYVLATKAMLGSIWGSSRRTVPASERFYEGSDNSLRGYRFLTISPLNKEHKPIGGRSMMIYSTELRIRMSETIGWVGFYDVGNVYSEILPKFDHKVLQSVGIGFRYHTPVGPLRIDLAFPLNPRPHLDHRFQVYLSIGQAF